MQVSSDLNRDFRSSDRRVYVRQVVHSLAYVELGAGNGGIVLNIGKGGMAVQAVISLMSDEVPLSHVQLAHAKEQIQIKGRIAWTRDLRKLAGIEFVDLSEESLNLIRQWISAELPAQQSQEVLGARTEEAAPVVSDKLAEYAKPAPESPTAPNQRERSKPVAVPTTMTNAPGPPGEPESSRIAPSATEVANPIAVASSVAPTPEITPPPDPMQIPPDRFGFKQTAQPEPVLWSSLSREGDNWKLTTRVSVFVVMSLAACWVAGHGALRGFFQKVAGGLVSGNAAAENPVQRIGSNLSSEVEVIDLNNQRWLVPMQEPIESSSPPTTSRTATSGTPSARNLLDLGASNLAGPVSSESSAIPTETAPQALPPSTSGPDGILSAANISERHDAISMLSSQPSATTGSGLQPGELIHKAEPEYPSAALAQKIEGSVAIIAVIDAEGKIKTAQASVLIPAALDAVRQWQYSPTLLDGLAIETERQITVTFKLSEKPH